MNIAALAIALVANAQDANRQSFNKGWRFVLGDDNDEYCKVGVKDDHWRLLNLPHDWAIEGDFSKDNPSGTGGGALPGGVGWYRKVFTLDKQQLKANGTDLSFVTVEVLDKDGNLCPNADNLIQFSVTGGAFIAGVDNGSPISMERFKDNKRKAFYGKCLVVLQNNDGSHQPVTLKAESEGLASSSLQITIK